MLNAFIVGGYRARLPLRGTGATMPRSFVDIWRNNCDNDIEIDGNMWRYESLQKRLSKVRYASLVLLEHVFPTSPSSSTLCTHTIHFLGYSSLSYAHSQASCAWAYFLGPSSFQSPLFTRAILFCKTLIPYIPTPTRHGCAWAAFPHLPFVLCPKRTQSYSF